MLRHHLTGGASKWCAASKHLPERHTKRVQVRADVNGHSRELLRAGKFRCSGESSGNGNRGFSRRIGCGLCQSKVDDLYGYGASFLQAHHDVTWFDIAMNELLFVDRRQTGSY